jgi:short subunit dehydrogenase-like uncharacterized protein
MTGKIVLFGATGYTGARIAEAMTRRGLTPLLAGRDRVRLSSIAGRLGGLPIGVADATDAGSIRALLEPGDVLVSTVGPFLRYGEAAVSAAVEAGAVYFDSTGEPPFIRRVFDHHGPAAERSGATLLPAFGNDFVPGTLAGALALTEAGAKTASVHTGYFITGGKGQGFSKGTLNSLAGVLLEPVFTWREGGLIEEPAGARFRTFPVAGKARPAISIGATEQFALPALAATGVAPALREVDTYLGWFGPASRALHIGAKATPLLRKLPRVGAGLTRALESAAGRAADEPTAEGLATTTSYFVGEAYDASGDLLASVTLAGGDGYVITAELIAWGAQQALRGRVAGTGALDAVRAFGLSGLNEGAEQATLRRQTS